MAPGYGSMSYAQDILIETLLADSSSTEVDTRGAAAYISPPLRQDYEAPILPQGLLLRLIIHSTWGDSHYVGLDAIVVRGADGRALDLHKDMVSLSPHPYTLPPSVILPNICLSRSCMPHLIRYEFWE